MPWSKSSAELLAKINKTISDAKAILQRIANASEREKERALAQLRRDYVDYSKEISLMAMQKQMGKPPELEITEEHIRKLRELQNLHARLKQAYARPWWAFWWYDGALEYYY